MDYNQQLSQINLASQIKAQSVWQNMTHISKREKQIKLEVNHMMLNVYVSVNVTVNVNSKCECKCKCECECKCKL